MIKLLVIIAISFLLLGCAETVKEEVVQRQTVGDGDVRVVDETGIIHYVSIEDYLFLPTDLEIKVGDTVEWVNTDKMRVTVTFEDLGFEEILPSGSTARHTFLEEGRFPYVSRFNEELPDTQDRIIHGLVVVG